MTRLKIKPGVRLLGLQPQIVLALQVLRTVWEGFDIPELVITSVTDGQHSKRSLHHKGLAIDLRTRNIGETYLSSLVAAAREALGVEFDVVFEGDHLHVEWDPKE